MIGRQYTWTNSLLEPTYEKLDRVLMDSDWEIKYPMVSVRALECIEALSDHAPILLNTGTPNPSCNLNWVGYIGKGFWKWLNWYGKDRCLV